MQPTTRVYFPPTQPPPLSHMYYLSVTRDARAESRSHTHKRKDDGPWLDAYVRIGMESDHTHEQEI